MNEQKQMRKERFTFINMAWAAWPISNQPNLYIPIPFETKRISDSHIFFSLCSFWLSPTQSYKIIIRFAL